MKILHIIPTYLPAKHSKGVIDSIHALNVELIKKGVDVTVYTTNLDGKRKLNVKTEKEIFIDGVRIIYFNVSFFKYWYYARSMRKKLNETVKNFDIIHITSIFLAESTLGAYYAKKFKKPYIITPHGSLMCESLKKQKFKKLVYFLLLEKRNIKNAILHFTTKKEREEYEKTKIFSKKNILISHPFQKDLKAEISRRGEFRKKIKISEKAPLILFIGRIAGIKGIDTLLSSFAIISKKNEEAYLVIIGSIDKADPVNIKKIISCFNLQRKVLLKGELYGVEKNEALQDADIFVSPSYSENFGMAIVEAMYHKLPVIITKGVGISDVVDFFNAGIVIEKKEEELTKAFLDLLTDSAKRKKMGQAGYELVEKEYNPAYIAEKWIQAYAEIIKENHG